MNMIFSFLENPIKLVKDKVNIVEVQNSNYFFRLTNLIYKYSIGEVTEEIYFYEDVDEIKNKINVITNYYDFDFNSKKNINELIKIISKELDDSILVKLNNNYNKVYKDLSELLSKVDLNFKIEINDEFNIQEILKNFNLSIPSNDRLIDNLLLLIDIEKTFNIHKTLVFINLKDYLPEEDLIEFEKYCIYNDIYVILFDVNGHKINNYENKFIIDKDLNETSL